MAQIVTLEFLDLFLVTKLNLLKICNLNPNLSQPGKKKFPIFRMLLNQTGRRLSVPASNLFGSHQRSLIELDSEPIGRGPPIYIKLSCRLFSLVQIKASCPSSRQNAAAAVYCPTSMAALPLCTRSDSPCNVCRHRFLLAAQAGSTGLPCRRRHLISVEPGHDRRFKQDSSRPWPCVQSVQEERSKLSLKATADRSSWRMCSSASVESHRRPLLLLDAEPLFPAARSHVTRALMVAIFCT